MATLSHPVSGSRSSRGDAFSSRSHSNGVGTIGRHSYCKSSGIASGIEFTPNRGKGTLPKSGVLLKRQKFNQDLVRGKPIVFSSVSGRERISVYIPEKGSGDGISTRKGLPTFYDPGFGQEVVHIDGSDPAQIDQFKYVKTSGFAKKYFDDLGQNHKPPKEFNYSFTNNTVYIERNPPGFIPSFVPPKGPQLDSAALNVVGSGGALMTGGINYFRAGSEMAAASRINDVAGKNFATLRYIRSFFEASKGVTLIIGYGFQLASLIGKVAAVALPIILGGFNLFFVCLPMVIKAKHSLEWKSELNAEMEKTTDGEKKLKKGLKYLLKKIEISEEEERKIRAEATEHSLYIRVAEDVFLNQDEEEILHAEDRERILQIVEEEMGDIDKRDFPLITDWKQVRQNLSIRLMKKWAHHKMTLEAEYQRNVGPKSLALLKKELTRVDPLRLRLFDESAAAEVQEILNQVHKEINMNVWITIGMVIGCIGTVIASALSAGIAAYVIGLVSNLVLTIGDIWFFSDDMMQNSNAGWNERMVIIVFALISLFMTVVGGVNAKTAGEMAVLIVNGVVMLGIAVAACVQSYKKENETKALESAETHRKIQEESAKQAAKEAWHKSHGFPIVY